MSCANSCAAVGLLSGVRQSEAVIEESVLWSYMVQLATALRSIHAASRACRMLDLSTVLLIDRNANRIKLNG